MTQIITQQVQIAVLGPPEIRRAGTPLTFATRKEKALLLYLAVEGGSHTRKQISEWLWPESDASHARSALRSLLLHLRALLPDLEEILLTVDKDTLQVHHSPSLWLDLRPFEMASARLLQYTAMPPTQQSSIDQAELLEEVEQAVSLYRGSFLEGFSLRDAPAFDTWMREQGEYLHMRFQHLCRFLAQRYEQTNQFEQSMRLANYWLTHDPLQEQAYLQLMRAQGALGERVAALRTYERCRAMLAREFGAEPGQLMLEEVTRLRDGSQTRSSGALSASPAPSHVPPSLAHLPISGRAEQMSALQMAYLASAQGKPQAVLLEGEAGIGKTRLLEEFVLWMQTQKIQVLQGYALVTRERLPYYPLIEALRAPLEQENAPDDLLEDVWLAELSRLFPELRDRYPDLPLPLQDETVGRLHLFEAIARLLRAWARRAPLVVCMEDLHWADDATLDLLAYLHQDWTNHLTPILFIGSLREEEADSSSILPAWIHTISRAVTMQRLRLPSLNLRQTRALVAQLIEDDPMLAMPRHTTPVSVPPASLEPLSQWLYRETEGHPLYVIETLKTLLEQDKLRWQPKKQGGWRLEIAGGGMQDQAVITSWQGILPASVRDLIKQRLSRLTPRTYQVLQAAAVLGPHFAGEQASRIAELGEEESITAMEEALHAQILVEEPQPGRTTADIVYSFVHDKLREVLYAEISGARRRLLHRRAFAVLEQVGAPAIDLVIHAAEAGLLEQTFHYSMRAADTAMTVFAMTDAIAYYQQARAIVEAGLPVMDTEIERLFVHLARALEALEQWEQAKEALRDLLTMGQRQQNHSLAVHAHIRLATSAIQANDIPVARVHLENALVLAEDACTPSTQADVLWNLAQFHAYYGNTHASVHYAERAVALAQERDAPALLANCLTALGVAYLWSGRFAETIATALHGHQVTQWVIQQEKMESLATNSWAGTALVPRTSYAAIDALCLANVIAGQVNSGQTVTVLAEAEAALASAYAHRDMMTIAHLATVINHVCLDAGDYERARTTIVDARQQTMIAQQLPLLFLWVKLGHTELLLGRLAEAEAALRQGDEIALRYFPQWRRHIVPWQCALSVLREDWEQAETLALLAHDVRQDAGTPLVIQDFVRWYETQALLLSGHAELAHADVAEFAQYIGENQRHRLVLLRMQAALAEYDGDLPQADAHLAAAQTLAQGLALPGDLWCIHAARGTLLQKMGQPDLARAAYEHAAVLIEELASRITNQELRQSFLSTLQVQHVRNYTAS